MLRGRASLAVVAAAVAVSRPLRCSAGRALGLEAMHCPGMSADELTAVARAAKLNAEAAAKSGFTRLAKHRSCGACVAGGGAWCNTDASRCVPDARGMRGAGTGPESHVGLAGRGRCSGGQAEFERQAYAHAPRRPPLPRSDTAACPATAAAATAAAVDFDFRDDHGAAAAATLAEIGVVVLPGIFQPAALASLRAKLVEKLPLRCSAEAAASK